MFKELSEKPKINNVLFIYAGINDTYTLNKGYDKSGLCFRILSKSLLFSKIAFVKHKAPAYSYEYNLERVKGLAQSYGLKIVISNLVGNITEFAPQDNQIFESKDNRVLFKKADEYVIQGNLDKAQKVYEQLINLNTNANLAQVYYCLGKVYRIKGDYTLTVLDLRQ